MITFFLLLSFFFMETDENKEREVFSPTLESFDAYISVLCKYVPEKIQIEKRLAEIRDFNKNKRVKKALPLSQEKVGF